MALKMLDAATRAEKLDGSSTPNGESGWCLRWCVVVVYGLAGPWKFVNRWGVRTSNAWAINYWYAAKKYGRVVETSNPARIPRGAMTFSKGGSKYGHVWITLGNSFGEGTDYPRTYRIGHFTIPNLLYSWRHTLLGYIEITGDGVDLRDPQTVEQRRMDPRNYYLGAYGEHILWLGERLVAHGYKRSPVAYKPTAQFTKADLTAVAWFQRKQGWDGEGADGLPGEMTLELLTGEPHD